MIKIEETPKNEFNEIACFINPKDLNLTCVKNITIEDLKTIIDLMKEYYDVLISDYNSTLNDNELILLNKLEEMYNETN